MVAVSLALFIFNEIMRDILCQWPRITLRYIDMFTYQLESI